MRPHSHSRLSHLEHNVWRPRSWSIASRQRRRHHFFRPIVEVLETRVLLAPVVNPIVTLAVYHDTNGAFGVAYDSINKRIHYTQGDSGNALIHTLKPFNSYTAAELAALPDIGGIKQISLAASEHDLAGTTAPSGGAVHFASLAFDASIGKLVYQSSVDLKAITPFAVGGDVTYSTVSTSFTDGLDVDGTNIWHSPDVDDIFKNGVLLIDDADLTKTTLPGWTGLGMPLLGWGGPAPNKSAATFTPWQYTILPIRVGLAPSSDSTPPPVNYLVLTPMATQ